jgi:hypothetical protein
MKRFVEVPTCLIENGFIPLNAHIMAKETLLEIQVVDSDDPVILIRSTPEHKSEKYPTKIIAGFIWPLDVIDEFHKFSSDTKLNIANNTSMPMVKEKHSVLFRTRIFNPGEYSFTVSDKEKEIASGKVLVI